MIVAGRARVESGDREGGGKRQRKDEEEKREKRKEKKAKMSHRIRPAAMPEKITFSFSSSARNRKPSCSLPVSPHKSLCEGNR